MGIGVGFGVLILVPNTRNVTVNVYFALASTKVIGLMKPYV